MDAQVGYIHDDRFLLHVAADPGCPEVPARLEQIHLGLRQAGLLERLVPLGFAPATTRQLAWVHDPEYVQLVQRECGQGLHTLSTGDTEICPATYEIALLAAGASMAAAQAILSGQVRSAFCAIRPPGHHATATRGMGFCVFNNAALAARYAQHVHHVRRVLIVDWDLHHGNGTQDIFYEDPGVFYFSIHQDGEYPMPEEQSGYADQRGLGKGEGTTLNVPLLPGSGDEEALEAFHKKLVPAMKDYRPEFVIISCGFDCRAEDLLGNLRLSDAGIAEMTRVTMAIAAKHGQGRVLSLLEGGYNLKTQGQAAAAHVKALLGE